MALRGADSGRCASCQVVPTIELAGFDLGGIALGAVRWFCGVHGYRFGSDYGCAVAVPFAVVLTIVLLCIVTTYFLSVFVALWRDRNLRSCSGVRWVLYTSCFFTYVALIAVKWWMKWLLLLSLCFTFFTGLLRAKGIANQAFVGWAMTLDIFGFFGLAIILGLLAARPELASSLWNIAARFMRHPGRRVSWSGKEAEDVVKLAFARKDSFRDSLRSSSSSQNLKQRPISPSRGEKFNTVINSFYDQCHKVGNELRGKNWIKTEDIESLQWSFTVGLPGVILFRCLMRSADPNVRGIKLADGSEVSPDFGNFAERAVIQVFCSLRDEVRQTILMKRPDLIQNFELKLLGADVSLAPIEESKQSTWAKLCLNAPTVNMVYSKIYGTTLSVTQLSIFKKYFKVFLENFDKQPFPGEELFISIQKGELDRVQKLLSMSEDKVDERSPQGATPLISAAMFGKGKVVQLLLDSKASVNAHTHQRKTALWCAACFGHCELVEALLKADADQNICESHGSSPLKVAQCRGHREVVDILRKHAEAPLTLYMPIQSVNDSTFGEWSTLQDQAQEEPLLSTVSFNPTIDD